MPRPQSASLYFKERSSALSTVGDLPFPQELLQGSGKIGCGAHPDRVIRTQGKSIRSRLGEAKQDRAIAGVVPQKPLDFVHAFPDHAERVDFEDYLARPTLRSARESRHLLRHEPPTPILQFRLAADNDRRFVLQAVPANLVQLREYHHFHGTLEVLEGEHSHPV